MSSYAEIQTEFKDPELLIAALGALGYDGLGIHLGNPQHLEAAWDDDLSEIIVPKGTLEGSRYGVGFARGDNGYFHTVVNTTERTKFGRGTAWENKVKTAYAEQNILRAARQQGLKAIQTGKKLDNGLLEYKFLKA